MYALSKLNKQNEQTWVNLQKRLNEVQFQYRSLFTTAEVHNFVKNKSLAVGSCEGYFIPSLLTTTGVGVRELELELELEECDSAGAVVLLVQI